MTVDTRGVIAYLRSEKAVEQLEFYKKAFGAVEHDRRPAPDGRLMHCQFEINGGSVMMSDAFPEHGYPFEGYKGVMLTLMVEDGQAWWDRAMAAGCAVELAFDTQFWGDRYGQFRDPFGVSWAINEPAKTA